jgi:hypothetical protein
MLPKNKILNQIKSATYDFLEKNGQKSLLERKKYLPLHPL